MAELFLGSHLTVLQTDGTLSAKQARQWWEYLQRADEQGTLMIGFTAFIVVGVVLNGPAGDIRRSPPRRE